jgi:putative lipoic acid-binding regulatory protein
MGKISIVTNTKEDIFNFPCEYPIKVFGVNQPDFEKTVCNIVETHIGKLHPNQTTIKYSSKGKYISLTVRIIATSRQQLDAINQDLQSCPLVSYLL